ANPTGRAGADVDRKLLRSASRGYGRHGSPSPLSASNAMRGVRTAVCDIGIKSNRARPPRPHQLPIPFRPPAAIGETGTGLRARRYRPRSGSRRKKQSGRTAATRRVLRTRRRVSWRHSARDQGFPSAHALTGLHAQREGIRQLQNHRASQQDSAEPLPALEHVARARPDFDPPRGHARDQAHRQLPVFPAFQHNARLHRTVFFAQERKRATFSVHELVAVGLYGNNPPSGGAALHVHVPETQGDDQVTGSIPYFGACHHAIRRRNEAVLGRWRTLRITIEELEKTRVKVSASQPPAYLLLGPALPWMQERAQPRSRVGKPERPGNDQQQRAGEYQYLYQQDHHPPVIDQYEQIFVHAGAISRAQTCNKHTTIMRQSCGSARALRR